MLQSFSEDGWVVLPLQHRFLAILPFLASEDVNWGMNCLLASEPGEREDCSV